MNVVVHPASFSPSFDPRHKITVSKLQKEGLIIKKTCIAALGSITAAIKSEKLLFEQGIHSEIIKVDPSLTERGCAYGVKFQCARAGSVEAILQRAKMEFKILSMKD